MKKKNAIKSFVIVLPILSSFQFAQADLVELDLLTLGCPQTYNQSSSYYQTDFDLGITFNDIDHVYIDWRGEITSGLATQYGNPSSPYPLRVGFYASMGFNPFLRRNTVWGGELTYPEPENFDSIFEIELPGGSTWSDLLDGQGTITLGYSELIIIDGYYSESGLVFLEEATMLVEGSIVPEPSSFLFAFFSGLSLFTIKRRKY